LIFSLYIAYFAVLANANKDKRATNMAPQSRIRIYNGGGALPMCSDASLFLLRDLFAAEVASGKLEVSAIDHHEIRSTTSKWQDDCALFVISGGGVTGFKDALQPDGLTAIKSYVSSGGQYLGMCAGAYFGAAEIDFTGHDWQSKKPYKKQSDGLGFFDGIAKGSIDAIAPLYDGTSATCRAIDVSLGKAGLEDKEAKSASVFYGGGPEFLMPEASSMTEAQIISRYLLDDGQTAVAGLSCPITNNNGRNGHALLLSWHADLNSKYIYHAIERGTPDPGDNRLNIANDMKAINGAESPAVKWLGQTLRAQLQF
jgi:biotin--protein ligase